MDGSSPLIVCHMTELVMAERVWELFQVVCDNDVIIIGEIL